MSSPATTSALLPPVVPAALDLGDAGGRPGVAVRRRKHQPAVRGLRVTGADQVMEVVHGAGRTQAGTFAVPAQFGLLIACLAGQDTEVVGTAAIALCGGLVIGAACRVRAAEPGFGDAQHQRCVLKLGRGGDSLAQPQGCLLVGVAHQQDLPQVPHARRVPVLCAGAPDGLGRLDVAAGQIGLTVRVDLVDFALGGRTLEPAHGGVRVSV